MNSKKVMIVEDKAMVAEDCRNCLESLGYLVTSILASGEESIEKAESEQPDIVLMDIHLRDKMNGIEAAEQIYVQYGIPVVFLSAYSDRELLERAKHAGAFGYLVKPFEERELFATLEMALHKAKTDTIILEAARLEATAALAGGLAHDYNNLMSIVLGNAELILENLGEDHPEAGRLLDIETAAAKASDLAQRLVAYARGGAWQMRNVDLSQIVVETIKAQERDIPSRVEILCDFDKSLWAIKADRAQLEMILTILCTNSVEAIEGIGEIRVTVQNVHINDEPADKDTGLKTGDYVRMSVEDSGCGMGKETLAKAFEPFFTTKFQGRGLGLAAVYGIVKNHGAHILLDSYDAKGTTCTIHFPAAEIEEKELAAPQTITASTETILVVDDEETIRKMVSLTLTQQGYRVLTANDGQAAIDVVRDHSGSIDLVLLDMGMPIMDGPTALPLLKKVCPEIKVILFSGYELDATMEALLDAGASSYLQKPVRIKKIKEEIRTVLDSVQ